MAARRIKVAITHGDINGIGYELLFKIFADERMTELCTPVLYGSEAAAQWWQRQLQLEQPVSWQLITAAEEAREGQLNLTQIADKLEFSSIHYFSRQFKKECKMSPSEYSSSIRSLSEEREV